VLALANVFEALTADRPWRPALTVDQALSDLGREAGTRFCRAAVAGLERWLGSPAAERAAA
jgi:HD-GYP domain-containing protein (c-di-GMP phosphodiesterase class II)